jgi:N-acetylglucosamine-6-phosphate deacetylase
MQIKGRDYRTGAAIAVTIEGEQIRRVAAADAGDALAEWPYLAPGIFDLQINGHAGTWFSQGHLTADDVIRTLEPHFKYGITRMCPTLVTASFEQFESGFSAIRTACEQEVWVSQMVAGCHMEGPYISKEDGPRGAHPISQVRRADWDEFRRLQEASGNRIILVTLAPEAQGAVPFIEKAVDSGVTIAIGHTGATPEQVTAAVDAGARLSTHLGNGAHGTLRRHPNYIWEQLGEPRLSASIITDGYHLPPSVIRSIVGVKGPEKTIITCDASGYAGCPVGVYEHGEVPVEVLPDGRLVIAGQEQLLAGSGVETDTCLAHALAVTDLSLGEVFAMAGRNPARLLGVDVVELQRHSRADLVAFNWSGPGTPLNVHGTMLAGTVKFGEFFQ